MNIGRQIKRCDMTPEELRAALDAAQERLSDAQDRLAKWYALNTGAIPSKDLTKPIRGLKQEIEKLKQWQKEMRQ